MSTLCIGGKNDITVNVLEYARTAFPDVRIVCIPDRCDDGINRWQRSVIYYCKNNGIEIVNLEDVYEIEDLVFISTEFDRIIKPEKFKSSNLYNIHFSLLPRYKGMFTSVLPILNGDDKSGVTFHRIRAGIDTGEIIDQQSFEIRKDWNSLDLYKTLINNGSDVVIRNLRNVLSGEVYAEPQPKEGSTYFGKGYIDFSSIELNPQATADQIRLQINAFAFRPYQLLKFKGIPLVGSKITDYVSIEKPGTVLSEDDVSIKIASIDYDIILYKDVLERIIEAVKDHDQDKAKRLCVYEKILNDQDSHGWTPLTVAVYNGDLDLARWFVSRGAVDTVVNHNGTTLLMYAKDAGLNTGDWSVFRWLREEGADPHAVDYSGKAIIDYLDEDKLNRIPEDLKAELK